MNVLLWLGLCLGLLIGAVTPATATLDPVPQVQETVVLIHGLGRTKRAMWSLARRLENAGYTVKRVGYGSLTNTPEQIVRDVSQEINACCADLNHPVHFVGHSLGGLIIRAYLDRHEVKHLGRTVLIGTPNKGTPIVDRYGDRWWMKLAGPTAQALGTDADSFPQSLSPVDYPLGVIAGVADRGPVSEQIPGADDGVVPVDSTRVEGMQDFIVLNTGHSMLRHDEDVARQVIEFLRHGRFAHP